MWQLQIHYVHQITANMQRRCVRVIQNHEMQGHSLKDWSINQPLLVMPRHFEKRIGPLNTQGAEWKSGKAGP